MREKSAGINMVTGSLWENIPIFALTIAATGILSQLFNAADIAIVGRFTGSFGTVAVAAVGTNASIISLILNLFIGIGLGTNVVIAHALGKKDEKAISKAVHTSIVLSLVGGIVVTILGQLLVGTLMHALHVPAEVLPWASLYLRIYLTGLPVIFLYNFEAAIFRSIGLTKVPLFALAFSGLLNVILNLFFVIVLNMSVSGVAIATVISNACSALYLFFRLIKTDLPIQVRPRELRIDRRAAKEILRIGLPAGIQSSVFSLSNIIIQTAINSLGTVVIAASSASSNVEIFCYVIMNSFSQACTTFVGQNYGAGQIERCKKTLKICLIEDIICYSITLGAALTFGKTLIGIFNTSPQVMHTGYERLAIITMAYLFSLLYENMSGYLRGFGISVLPAILTTIGICGVRILWIATIFQMDRRLKTIMFAYPVSLSFTAVLILCLLLYFRPSKRFAGGI